MKADRDSGERVVIPLPGRRQEGPERATAAAGGSQQPGARPLSLWLGLALALVAALLVAQIQRADRLAGRVQDLSHELQASQSALSAYQDRMKTVRVRVSGLSAQLDELERLVEQEPTSP